MAERILCNLAQGDFADPLVKYFSFIVLGLLMTFGYIFVRILDAKKKKKHASERSLESALRQAEQEARERKQLRDAEGEALALSPEEESRQLEVRRIAEEHEAQSPATPQKDSEAS